MITIENVTIEFVWNPTLNRLCHKVNFEKSGDTESETVTLAAYGHDDFDSSKIDDYRVQDFQDTDNIDHIINAAITHSYNFAFMNYFFYLNNSDKVYGPFKFYYQGKKELQQIKLEHERSLRRKGGYGRRTWLFKKNRLSEDCDTCFDEVRGISTDSQCPDCNGTGKKDRISKPFDCYISYSTASFTESDIGTTKLNEDEILSWGVQPMIYPGDILVRQDDKKIFHVGSHIKNIGQNDFVIRQLFKLIEFKVSEPLYKKVLEQL